MDGCRFYRAHGLIIKSPIRLPDFLEIKRTGSFDLEILKKSRYVSKLKENWFFKRKKDYYLLYFKEVGLFKTRKHQVLYWPDRGRLISYSHLYLSGLVIGAYLLREGFIVLHGSSVVDSSGDAIMFLGKSGAGKSTIVAGLIDKGYSLLSDDVVALSPRENVPYLTTGKIRVQLSKDIAQKMPNSFKEDEKNPLKDKYFYKVNGSIREQKCRLRAVYFLQNGKSTQIERVSKSEAIFHFIENSMESRFFTTSKRELKYFSGLVEKVKMYNCIQDTRHRSLEQTSKILDSHIKK